MKEARDQKNPTVETTQKNPDGSLPISDKPNGPKQVLRVTDAIVIIVGIVVGAGIFRTPSIVASGTGSPELFLGTWVVGGVISLIGAMCYAELSTAFPSTGGDYHFLHRAFGRRFAFLFAWARMSIIQTGSIALLAFVVGDYMSELFSLGPHSSAIYAALVVIGLTFINIIGIHVGTGTQKFLIGLQFVGLSVMILAGLLLTPESPASTTAIGESSGISFAIGGAMVMVLLTFGGWNEAGYISAEMRGGSKKMAVVMIGSILIITCIYLLMNLTYLRVLGIDGLAASPAVGVNTMRAVMGDTGVYFMGLLVVLAALTSANATVFTGARTNHALGRDFPQFSFMKAWKSDTSAPVNALLVQGTIATLLIGIGSLARSGFESMVDFTAPIFWFFILFTGIALFVLRYREPHAPRPFKVPLYPILPLVFCLTSGYLLYSSLIFAGKGAWLGVAVLLSGTLFFYIGPKSQPREQKDDPGVIYRGIRKS